MMTQNKKVPIVFTILIAAYFVAMIIPYGVVSRHYQQFTSYQIDGSVVTIQDSNKAISNICCLIMDTVFTMLGFGLLLSPWRNQKWSGMASALFVVSFNILMGLLIQDMWFQIFFGFRQHSDFDPGSVHSARQFWSRHQGVRASTSSFYSFRLSNLCSTAYLVGMTAFSGRVSILKLVISMPIFCVLYYLNFYLNILVCYSTQNKSDPFTYLDAYGTILVYLFGGVYGIIVGFLTKVPKDSNQQGRYGRISRASLHLSLLGSLFLFATFCLSYTGILSGHSQASQNFRYNASALLVMFGLIGGILGNYCLSFLLGKGKMNIESIVIGTISGGIMVGGLADIIQNIGACLFLGFIAGAISAAFMTMVSPKFNNTSIIDSQGLLGPILVVSFLACMVVHPSILSQVYIRRQRQIQRGVGYAELDFRVARYHLAYLALTVVFAAITGAILGFIYKRNTRQNTYQDTKFFAQDYGLFSIDYNPQNVQGQQIGIYSAGNIVTPTANQFDI